MFTQEILIVLKWWLMILIIGISFMPLTSMVFSSYNDKGYLFSKPIGIAISGYIVWLLSSLKLSRFTGFSSILVLIFCLILNIYIAYKNKTDYKTFYRIWLKEELIFFILFIILSFLKSVKPEAHGTEKFMDYGLINSIMKNEYMPPIDFWASGEKLNYYYLGQYFAAFLGKLSFIESKYIYNLMLVTIPALSFLIVYSLVYNITKDYFKESNSKNNIYPNAAGIISSLAVNLSANMHYPIYRWIIPFINKLKNKENTYKYWFPDATRYIGYFPETNDKTIHEFPSYSYVLGDLHAHVINIIFVLSLLGILYMWFVRRKDIKDQENINYIKEIYLNPHIILISFFIGLFQMTNFWDFPIYYVVSGAVILFTNFINYKERKKAFILTGIQGVYIFLLAKLFALPFVLNFDKISTRILPVEHSTPLHQWLLLWFFPLLIAILFIKFVSNDFKKNKTFNIIDLFIILISLCAIGLIIMPEIVYVEDIYPNHKRANTMFKLTYQAYIMFSISMGYIIIKMFAHSKNKARKFIAILATIVLSSTIFYSFNAYGNFFGNPFIKKGKTLDSSKFMEKLLRDDYFAIEWINDNIKGNPVMLEAYGDSYSDYQRVSVFTGLPTVIGWETHEWLWRSSYDFVVSRQNDIKKIYTLNDETQVKELIDKYNISYIYIGKLEYDKFSDLNYDLLLKLGDLVYISPEEDIFEYQTCIIKIY